LPPEERAAGGAQRKKIKQRKKQNKTEDKQRKTTADVVDPSRAAEAQSKEKKETSYEINGCIMSV
jgi:hypothetical protein